MNTTLTLTRITSNKTISKGFRLRGQALEKIDGGSMYSGTAERIHIDDLVGLAGIIQTMNTSQALTYGQVTLPGDRHAITTQKYQENGKNIARTRQFFEFRQGQQGILLLDYDPPAEGEPLSAKELMETLHAVIPGLRECETLIVASASAFIYKVDGTQMRGGRGWHVFVRAENAADIPALGEAIAGRCWLAGLGRVNLSSSGGKLLRNLVDESVWQPERLSYDAGADCGKGLIQKRPTPIHSTGRALALDEVALTDEEMDKVEELKDAARGVPPRGPGGGGGGSRARRKSRDKSVPAPLAVQPLTPKVAARVMNALLHIRLEVDYETHTSVGMGLKNSFGDAGFALWNAWSKPSRHYRGEHALRAVWTRFTRQGYTVKTVYHFAKQQGWSGKPARVELPLPVRALPENVHETLAETVSTGKARATTLQTLYGKIVLDENPPAISALRITVGVGKTSSLKKVFDDIKHAKKSILIVAKDRVQCAEYEKAGAFWRHGRELTEHGFTAKTPWHCPNAGGDGPVEKLAEAEHRLQEMCRGGHCAHGNKAMLDNALATGKEPSETVVRFFREKPELRNVEPCLFFDHMKAAQHHKIRVVTAAGISPSDLKTTTGQVDFLVIDESVEWSKSHFLTLPTVREYIVSLDRLKKAITKNDQNAPTDFLDAPVKIFRELALQMGRSAATSGEGVYEPINFDLSGIVESLNAVLDDHGAAIWEKPQWKHWTELLQAPLRALSAIKDGLRAGSLSMKDGSLHLTYLHSVLENALKAPRPIPIIVMDATLDQTATGLIPGECVTHIVANPNVEWKIDPRWFVSAKNDLESLQKEAQKLNEVWQKQEEMTGHQSYVICRMALALFLLKQKGVDVDELMKQPSEKITEITAGERIGWWNRHDTAHDFWNGYNAVLWGQPPVPDDVRLEQYMNHRAALMLIMPQAAPLPMADNQWASDLWVQTGDHEQQSQARLPVQPEVREWLLKTIAGQRIQGAGRSRAVCQDRQVSIWQIGGYPMTSLAEHGIRPNYERLVDRLSREEVEAIRLEQRKYGMSQAAAALVARGDTISRPKMREMIGTLRTSLKNNKSSDTEPVWARYIYIYPEQTGLLSLDSSKNNGLDNNEYETWRTDAESQRLFAGRFDVHDSQAPALMVDEFKATEAPASDEWTILSSAEADLEAQNYRMEESTEAVPDEHIDAGTQILLRIFNFLKPALDDADAVDQWLAIAQGTYFNMPQGDERVLFRTALVKALEALDQTGVVLGRDWLDAPAKTPDEVLEQPTEGVLDSDEMDWRVVK